MQSRLGQLARTFARVTLAVGGAVLEGSRATLFTTPRKIKFTLAKKLGDFIPGAREWHVLQDANTNKFTKNLLGADWTSFSKTLDGAQEVEFEIPRALVPIEKIHAFESYLDAVANGLDIVEAREKNKGNGIYQLHMDFVELGGGVQIRENSKDNQAEIVVRIPLCESKAEFRERVAKAIVALGVEDSYSVDEATNRLWRQRDVDFGNREENRECKHDHGHHENHSSEPSSRNESSVYDTPRGVSVQLTTTPDPTLAPSQPSVDPSPDLSQLMQGLRLKPVATEEKLSIIKAANALLEVLKFRNFDEGDFVSEKELKNLVDVCNQMRISGALQLSEEQKEYIRPDFAKRLCELKEECLRKASDTFCQSGAGVGSSVDPIPSQAVKKANMYKFVSGAAEDLLRVLSHVPGMAAQCGLEYKPSALQSSLSGRVLDPLSGMPIADTGESRAASLDTTAQCSLGYKPSALQSSLSEQLSNAFSEVPIGGMVRSRSASTPPSHTPEDPNRTAQQTQAK